MRGFTLAETGFSSQFLCPPYPKPPKSLASNLLSLNVSSHFEKHSSKLPSRHRGFIFPRCARKWCEGEGTRNEFCLGFLQNGFVYSSLKDGEETRESIDEIAGYIVSEESSMEDNLKRENFVPTDILVSNTTYKDVVKFMLLFGFLTLQGLQPALAGPDASGLQSIPYLGDLGDINTGFASAFLLIFFSELGDKTFFIAALLAARNSAAVVFLGTFGALAAMTIISVVLGRTFHYVDEALPFRFGGADLPIDDIAAICLLVYFGVSTLLDAASSDNSKAEDEQKEAELAVSEFSGNGAGILAAASTVISTFILVFVAEWGDKSFFSTIALAAASSPLGVIGGALAGHGVATLLAVLGGSLLGTFLSEKTISYIGGALFLVFAAVTLIEIVN